MDCSLKGSPAPAMNTISAPLDTHFERGLFSTYLQRVTKNFAFSTLPQEIKVSSWVKPSGEERIFELEYITTPAFYNSKATKCMRIKGKTRAYVEKKTQERRKKTWKWAFSLSSISASPTFTWTQAVLAEGASRLSWKGLLWQGSSSSSSLFAATAAAAFG